MSRAWLSLPGSGARPAYGVARVTSLPLAIGGQTWLPAAEGLPWTAAEMRDCASAEWGVKWRYLKN